jgi:hypothetical protein
MKQQNNKSTEIQSTRYKTDKTSLFIGGIIVILIAVSPFLFYLYESFPVDSKVWETSFFKMETNFKSMYHYAWFFTGKSIPLYLLLLWFFTCKHWWHWIILVPIAMYSFQLWGVINQNEGLDEIELFYILPLMMVLVPAVYLIRAKLFNKVRGNDLRQFEEELGQKQSVWQQILDLFR